MRNSSFVTIFNRVTFIARAVTQNDEMTVEDIDSKWRDSSLCDGSSIDRFKLNRDRSTIRELYGIDIRSRRLGNGVYCYYVHNIDDISLGGLIEWTFNTLSMVEMLNDYHDVRDRIFLEGYSPDRHTLMQILEAMRKNQRIRIEYKRFTSKESKSHIVEPFCIRDYQRRLYVVARIAGYRKLCVFSLDRIAEIKVTDTKFKMPPNFSPATFFADAFGVMVPDNMQPEQITLRAYGDEMLYLASKPLHQSQKPLTKVEITEPFADFSLFLTPTLDFMGYMLSRADRLEVVSPQWLRDKIMKAHSDSLLLYRRDDSTLLKR